MVKYCQHTYDNWYIFFDFLINEYTSDYYNIKKIGKNSIKLLSKETII
jgi:hypothetical protein